MKTLSARTAGLVASALFGAAILVTPPAYAYKVSPLVMTLEPIGDGAKQDLIITNTHDYPLTLEITATERSISTHGEEDETDASEDWIIFPPLAIVEPGKQQRVRLQYAGGALTESKAYRIIVGQVAVDDGSGNLNVSFNYKFKTAAYVAPKGAVFNIETDSITPADNGYTVELSNSGNRHAVLSSGTWTGTDNTGKSLEIDMTGTEVKQDPLIAPGGSRVVFVPTSVLGDLSGLSNLSVKPER